MDKNYYNIFKNQQNALIKIQCVIQGTKHTSYQVSAPTCFGNKVPSSATCIGASYKVCRVICLSVF